MVNLENGTSRRRGQWE